MTDAALQFDRGSVEPTRALRLRKLEAFLRVHATPGRVFAGGAAIYLLLCTIAYVFVRPTTLLYFADYWEHRAIIAEIIRHGANPLDPIYGEAASSRQYTPWSMALGYLARLTALDIDTVMAIGAMLVSLLFVAGVYAFARAFFIHRWAPPILLAALTCAWGLPPLIWTGFHSLRSQLHGNYYPATLVFALTFIAWAAALHILKGKRFGALTGALLGVLVAVSVITHPLNALFLIAGAAGFALIEPGIAMRRRATVLLVIAAGIASTAFWPWFNPLSLGGAGLARGQATFNNFSFFFDPLFVIAMAWPAIFVLLGLPGLMRDRTMRVPMIALGLTFSAYVVGGIADVSVSHRLLAYVILALQLLMVKAALDVIDGAPPQMMDKLTPRAWKGVIAGSALLIVWQIGLAVEQLTDPWADTHYPYPTHQVEADSAKVVATLPPGARVLGWDSAALVMPANRVLVASFPRPMPLSPSDNARQTDYRRFFSPGVSRCERLAIARRWNVTHIAWLTIELREDVQRELAGFGPATAPLAPWRIIPLTGVPDTSC